MTKGIQAAFQSLSTTVIYSDLLKFFLDLGTGAVSVPDSVIDKFNTFSSLGGNISSSFGTIGALSGLFAVMKNVGGDKMCSPF